MMRRTIGRAILAGAAVAWASACEPAAAAEGFLGLYAHDLDDQISIGRSPETGAQVIAGGRTARLDRLRWIGRPQAHLFGAVNTAGGVDYAAAGLSWRVGLGARFYLQPGIGVAAHTGKVDLPDPGEPGLSAAVRAQRRQDIRSHLDLGSRWLFAPELSIGWRANERLAVELSWIHVSHAQLAGPQNPGMSDLGLRLVFGF